MIIIITIKVSTQAISGPHPPSPSPKKGEGELNPFKVPLPSEEKNLEGFRVRADRVVTFNPTIQQCRRLIQEPMEENPSTGFAA